MGHNMSIGQSLGISGGNNHDLAIDRTKYVSSQVIDVVHQTQKSISAVETEQDIRDIRNNLKRLISAAEEAVEDFLVIAKDSQHPRAFEVLGGLISHTAAANQSLLDLHDKITQLRRDETTPSQKADTINNNQIIVNSTDELLSTLKKMKETNGTKS
jgi:hypothetical protein